MELTTREIADACGVSRGTVDRALNNRPGISEETRKMILDTAKKMGYRPNMLARSLSKGCTMTLGIVLFDVNNRFFAQLINAMEVRARELGYFAYLSLTGKDNQVERQCVEHMMERKVDGLVLCSAINSNDYADYLKKLKIPVVTVGNRLSPEIPYAGIDDYAAMLDATRCVLDKGYTNLVYLSPPLRYEGKSNIYAQKQRYLSFMDAVRSTEKEICHNVIMCGEYLREIDGILSCKAAKPVVMCSSDLYALEVLDHLKHKSCKVPEDVGLMGFDNIDVLKYIEPRLNTVSYPIEEIGINAVNRLVECIERDSSCSDVILPYEIMEGSSL